MAALCSVQKNTEQQTRTKGFDWSSLFSAYPKFRPALSYARRSGQGG